MQIKILIPVYKEHLSVEELRSFKQCLTVLRQYPIILVTYDSLNLDAYLQIARQSNVVLEFEYFKKEYFVGITSYNRLLLDRDFYQRFRDSDYMFIYQLDGFVFRDELEDWCGLGYDYIGAPWFKNYKSHEEGAELYKVGNGGVSLRKVATFLDIFDKPMPLAIFPFYLGNIRKKGFVKMAVQLFKMFVLLLFTQKNVRYYLRNFTDERINEDCFWADGLSRTNLSLSVPNIMDAARFCVEKSPTYLFELMGGKLPFACHAYEKYEFENFWRNYI